MATHPAAADPPLIVAAAAMPEGAATWRFDVTLRHPDTGWDHYADGWQVETSDGKVLGYRELLHPHVNEQPFTRSLGGVTLPGATTRVFIRARDNVDGWADALFPLELPPTN